MLAGSGTINCLSKTVYIHVKSFGRNNLAKSCMKINIYKGMKSNS